LDRRAPDSPGTWHEPGAPAGGAEGGISGESRRRSPATLRDAANDDEKRSERMSRLVDLSMAVHRDMVTFPRINPPQMLMFDTWEDFAKGVGADKYGVDKLTASYTIIQSDHAGTHMDAVKHIRPD